MTSGSSATNLLAIGSDRGIQHNLSVSAEQEATTMQSWCCAPPPHQRHHVKPFHQQTTFQRPQSFSSRYVCLTRKINIYAFHHSRWIKTTLSLEQASTSNWNHHFINLFITPLASENPFTLYKKPRY